MKNIRRATADDLCRVAEIEIFNYRLNFYPIFKNDDYYFSELRVTELMGKYKSILDSAWVYDDGVVKGFIQVTDGEIKKLFVEPVLQGDGIGSALLCFAKEALGASFLWALEKNVRAIKFYEGHGFRVTNSRRPEDDTAEYLVRLERDFYHSAPKYSS